MSETLILPFAPLHTDRKLPFSSEMEIAAIVCSAESKRKKKGGILGGKPERIASIAKLYYPLWLVPWENECVAVDGMKVFSFEAVYGEVPDCDSFLQSVLKTQTSYEQFVGFLQQNTKVFADFAASQKNVLEGVIVDKELQDAVFEYYRTEMSFKEHQPNESALLKVRLNKETALARVKLIDDLWKRNQSDRAALQRVLSALDDATAKISGELSKNIEAIKQEYEDKIEKLRPIVDEKVRQLTNERDTKIKTVTDATAAEIMAWTKERESLEAQLGSLTKEKTELEEKKQLAKLRKDEENVKRWKFSVKEREQRISEISKGIRRLREQTDRATKETEKTVKQTNETYQAQIDAENGKIHSLENAREKRIAEIQENINQMRIQVDEIKTQIGKLLEEKNASAEELKGVAVSWKLEAPVSMLLPFYAVDYVSESKEHYEFYSPVLASSPEGVLKAIKRKFWGFSLDARIGLLLRQRSKALDKMLSSVFSKKLDTDRELHNIIREKMQQNNIILAQELKETLKKGLDSLVTENWVKTEERDMILQMFPK